MCGAREFVAQAHSTLGPKAQAEETYCRGRVLKAPKKAQGCGRGRSYAQHPTGHLKKKDEFNVGTRQVKKLPIL